MVSTIRLAYYRIFVFLPKGQSCLNSALACGAAWIAHRLNSTVFEGPRSNVNNSRCDVDETQTVTDVREHEERTGLYDGCIDAEPGWKRLEVFHAVIYI